MKRSDIEVGAEYAVLAPSQDPRRMTWRDAKRVRVLDVEPVWNGSTSDSSWWGRNDKMVEVVDFDGNTVEARDYTRKAYDERDGKRAVKVVSMVRYGGGVVIETVPVSQVRMTWAEYRAIREDVKREQARVERARVASRKAKEVQRADAERRRDAVNEVLAGTNLTARILDGEVVIAGPAADLLDAARLVEYAARVGMAVALGDEPNR